MFLYLSLYAFLAAAGYAVRNSRQSRMLALFATLFLTLFIGLRYDVGCDFSTYENRFNEMYTGIGWIEAYRMGEGGFHWLNMAVQALGFDYDGFLMVCAMIYTACLFAFAKLARQPMAFLALSFPILILQLGMSGTRQALATGFLMLAFIAYTRNRRLAVALLIVLASQFHTSAIIFLPLALLLGRRINTVKLFAALMLVSPAVGWFLSGRISTYNDRYIEQIYGVSESSGAWFRYAITVIPYWLLIWKRKAVAERFPDTFPMMWLFCLASFALVPIGLFSSIALHRMTFYLLPISLLALLSVSEVMFRQNSRQVGAAIPFVMYGAYIGVWFALSRHATECYVPYQSWAL